MNWICFKKLHENQKPPNTAITNNGDVKPALNWNREQFCIFKQLLEVKTIVMNDF